MTCKRCQGDGYINIHANLPDVVCPECNNVDPNGLDALRTAHIDSIIRAPQMKVPSMQSHPMINGSLSATAMTFGDMVRIDLATGAITRLPGFTTTDAAALAFWEAVERLAPKRDRRTISYHEFNHMPPDQQAKFVNEGGKVDDDMISDHWKLTFPIARS